MTLLLRAAFLILAVLAVVTQVARSRSEALPDHRPALEAAVAALGLRPTAPVLPGTLAAEAEGCPQPVTLAEVDFNGLGQATARALLALPGVPRFVYLGFVGGDADLAAISARWAGAGLLQVLGLRQGEVPREVVLVMLPRACPRLTGLDWSALSPWG